MGIRVLSSTPKWKVSIALKKAPQSWAPLGEFFGNDKKAVEKRAWEYALKHKSHMLSSSRQIDYLFNLQLKED
jgi:hypothetical protein